MFQRYTQYCGYFISELGYKSDPQSVIISVGRYACLVMMYWKTFAVFTAVGLETGYAKAYLENTSFAVTMFT